MPATNSIDLERFPWMTSTTPLLFGVVPNA
ncbi:hypothetical protein BH10PSE16_BH10PSE16_10880 [soil metagenome]